MEIARLRDDLGRVERAISAEAARQQQHAERLDRLGLSLLTRSGRQEGRQLGAMIERSERTVERLDAEQGATGLQLRALRSALQRWDCWERELALALSGRAEALEAEIGRRVQARLADIEHEPPAYLTMALGPRPEGSARWRQGAAAIEGYRERHGVTDTQQALGPEERLHLGERRSVEREVADVCAELGYIARAHERWDTARPERGYDRGPRLGLGHGVERGLEHGPSLGMGR